MPSVRYIVCPDCMPKLSQQPKNSLAAVRAHPYSCTHMMQLMHAHGTAQGDSMYIRMKVTAQNIESLLHGEALSNWRRETWAARTSFLEAYDEVFTEDAPLDFDELNAALAYSPDDIRKFEDACVERQCRGKNGCGLWHLFK